MLPLATKVTLVTGGGTGIGAAIARTLAAAGSRVVVCGRRIIPLQTVVDDIQAAGGVGLAIPADVSQEEDVALVIRTALEAFGGVDILVNNAGIDGGGMIHEHDVAAWDQILAINLRGPFLFCRYLLPLMRQRGGGHIINISSESGLNHYEGDGAYGVSKHALNALSEYIQRENQAHQIRVDTICPGMVVTEMTEQSVGLDHEKCLYPADIADLVFWLTTRRPNVKIGSPILIQTMENPWRAAEMDAGEE